MLRSSHAHDDSARPRRCRCGGVAQPGALVGRSEAVNQLIRAGLKERKEAKPFRQRSRSMGLRIDVTNVAEALDLLDGPASR